MMRLRSWWASPELRGESRELWRLAWPTTVGDMLLVSETLIVVACIGHKGGKDALDAVTVATAYMSITDVIPFSLSNCLNTLCSQARGAGNKPLAGIWLQTSLLVYTAVIIPTFVLWAFTTKRVLRLVGLEDRLAEMGQTYALYSIPLAYCSGLRYCVDEYYSSLGIVLPATVTAAIFTPMSVGFSILLMSGVGSWEGLGFEGAALGGGLAVFLEIVVFLLWCWHKEYHKGYWDGWSWSEATKVSRVSEYLKQGMSQALGAFFEEAQFEFIIVFITHMGTSYVAAWSCVNLLWMLCFTACSGFGKAVNMRVALHVGADDVHLAKIAVAVGVVLIVVLETVAVGILVAVSHHIGHIFTNDHDVIRIFVSAMPYLAISLVPLAAGVVALFVLDAQGRPNVGATIIGLATWFFNVPVAAVVVYVWGKKLNMLLNVMTVGYLLACVVAWVYILRSDWDHLVVEAQKRSEVEGLPLLNSDGEARCGEDDDIVDAAAGETPPHSRQNSQAFVDDDKLPAETDIQQAE
eukprot:Rhum_TRINITY_DN7835_c0_g1::Rhum_TRINITY_DN7835_c0_g1_i1::g.24733::m.24733/K03327/TC.MATE, SLC47A, norM, mdtK, dinF; multidrug resistance protein, MATE family